MLAPAMVVAEVLTVFVSWLFIRGFLGRDWKRKLAVRLPSFTHLVLALVALPGLMIFVNGLDQFVKSYIPLPSLVDLETVGHLFQHWPWWFGVLVIGLGPGLGEELWCRGFLGQGLIGRYGVVVGIALTSFLFGAMHIEPRQVIYAPVMGVALHFVYLATRSFLMPVLLHFLNNSIAVLEACQDVPGTPHVPGLQSVNQAFASRPIEMVLVGLVVVAAAAWALYQSRVRLAIQLTDEDQIPWELTSPSTEHPPPASGRQLVRPPVSLVASVLVVMAVVAFVAFVYLAQPV
jgi:membrane protease YdiL (CAAX protease family)